jgi:hypothetical protein
MPTLTAPSIPQVAAALAISEPTAYRIFRRGLVSGAHQHPITNKWLIPMDAIDQIKAAFQID